MEKQFQHFIEEGTDTIKRQLQDLSYVNSVGEEKESGRLMNVGIHIANVLF